jgi:predicted dinucleotide-binding enzyme
MKSVCLINIGAVDTRIDQYSIFLYPSNKDISVTTVDIVLLTVPYTAVTSRLAI